MLKFQVNKQLCNLIDYNKSLWSRVSYQNLWPTTASEKELFRRGADAFNEESLVKLGLAHLYHYNLTGSGFVLCFLLKVMFVAPFFRKNFTEYSYTMPCGYV